MSHKPSYTDRIWCTFVIEHAESTPVPSPSPTITPSHYPTIGVCLIMLVCVRLKSLVIFIGTFENGNNRSCYFFCMYLLIAVPTSTPTTPSPTVSPSIDGELNEQFGWQGGKIEKALDQSTIDHTYEIYHSLFSQKIRTWRL